MTVLVVTILSLLMELIAFRPVRDASPVVLIVTSFAVSYGIQQLAWTDVFGLAHRFRPGRAISQNAGLSCSSRARQAQ